MRDPLDTLPPVLDENELSPVIRRAVSTIQKDRLIGGGVPFIRIGRQVRYRRSDVIAWLDALPTRQSTSAAEA